MRSPADTPKSLPSDRETAGGALGWWALVAVNAVGFVFAVGLAWATRREWLASAVFAVLAASFLASSIASHGHARRSAR